MRMSRCACGVLLLPILQLWVLCTTFLCAPPLTASAAFLFSNLDPNESLNTAGLLSGFEASGAISVGFQANANVTLSTVEFRLKANTGSSTSRDATLVLRQDSGGNPGLALSTFQSITLGTSFQNATFIPTATTTLSAGTTYWLTLGTTIVSGVDGDGLVAGSRNPAVDPTGADAIFVGLRMGTPDLQLSNPFFIDSPSIQISGITAVPEPSICGALAVTAIAAWSRRRKFSIPNRR